MGNAHGNHFGEGEYTDEWKGPLSDEEFNALVKLFESCHGPSKNTIELQTNLEKAFTIKINCDAPAEFQPVGTQFGQAFYRFCLATREKEAKTKLPPQVCLNDLVRGVSTCSRGSSQSILRALVQLFDTSSNGVLSPIDLEKLFFVCFCMADEQYINTHDSGRTLKVCKSLVDAALSHRTGQIESEISTDGFLQWINTQFPLFYSIFASWTAHRCFGRRAKVPFHLPEISHQSDICSKAELILLSTVNTHLQNEVDRLYTSTQDGLSFNRLCYHILGYNGPTLVIIQDSDGDIFGMFGDTEWKESSKHYGTSGCFLFRLQPEIAVYRVSASAGNACENYMYLNRKGVAVPRGFGMGGSTSKLRIFLDEDFEECYTTPKDLSFENGRLTKTDQFTLDVLEVWGCGGEESRKSQMKNRAETEDLINRARKVDKAQFIGNEFDKEMFLSKTFGHGGDRGRVADDVDE